ncbi:MAG: hypothetical protein Q4A74_03255 [Cardiobacteriaceae bacterium]|nr:hypothetical protein [Cardiobacteriaceae bacterium]
MRLINTLKQLKDWKLTQQENKKTWALLPFIDVIPEESQILLKGAHACCDIALVALEGDSTKNHNRFIELEAQGCDAVLLLGNELNVQQVTGLNLHFSPPYPSLLQQSCYQSLGLKLLRLFSLLQPQMAVLSLHDLPRYWITNKLCEEFFIVVEIIAAAPIPEDSDQNILYSVLRRCAQAIHVGHDIDLTLHKGREILRKWQCKPRYFDCYNINTFTPTHQIGSESLLWALPQEQNSSGYAVRVFY